MDFVNSNLSGVFKIIVAMLVISILIRIIPLLIIPAIAVWGGYKGIRYFNNCKNRKIHKKEKATEYVHVEKEFFDLSDKNIVDVEYEEVRK